MAQKIIKGNDLMLFDNEGKSYAYATNHTLTINSELADVSSKDHGIWGASEVVKYTWEIQTENLYTETDYYKMFDIMLAGQMIDIKFGLKKENDNTKTVADGDYDNWTASDTPLTGKAYITSLVTNANNGENATYSVTLTGAGKIVHTKAEGSGPRP